MTIACPEDETDKREKVLVALTERLVSRLDAEAKRRVLNRSLLIRLACEKYLHEIETEAA